MRARNVRIPRAARIVRLLSIAALVLTATNTAWALRHLKEGDPLPSFAAKAMDGTELTNKTFAGKPLIIVFARPGHAESERALQEVGALLGQRKDTDLAGIAVPTGDDPDGTVQRFAGEHRLPLTIVSDPDRRMYGDFGVIVSPTVLFVDGKGILRFHVPHLPPGYARVLAADADFISGAIDATTHAGQVSNAPEKGDPAERSFETRLAFARMLVRHGKDAEAREILDGLQPVGGKSAEAAALLATLLLRQGDTDRAAALLGSYDTSEKAAADVHLAVARLAAMQGRADMAELHLKAAGGDGPSHDRSEILRTLGMLYEKQNVPEKALECYRTALDDLLETRR